MSLVHGSSRRFVGMVALALAPAFAALALLAAAPASAATCPTFQVLHNDRIGPASLPAGNYEISVKAGLSCEEGAKLFARFLQDWDGNLPKPWRVVAEESGKASFTRGNLPGFTVERIGGGGGGNPELGKLCPGTFTVNAGSDVGPLFFAKGPYLIYIPTASAITCRRASVLFTRFLGSPGGQLPFPWRVKTQTATFYKPAHPLRSAFRIEPANGV